MEFWNLASLLRIKHRCVSQMFWTPTGWKQVYEGCLGNMKGDYSYFCEGYWDNRGCELPSSGMRERAVVIFQPISMGWFQWVAQCPQWWPKLFTLNPVALHFANASLLEEVYLRTRAADPPPRRWAQTPCMH